MKRWIALLLVAAVSGCANAPNVDLSNVETTCGQRCAANYSECSSRFSLTPIYTQSACSNALQVCAQSCPARGASQVLSDPTLACYEAALADPALADLRRKLVLGLEHPTLDMQSNESVPDAADRAALRMYAGVRERCFDEGAAWRAQVVPYPYRGIGEQAKAVIDANLAALYRGAISFGEFNVRIEAVRLDGRRRNDEAREIARRETDAAKRQAALAALLATPMPPASPRPQPRPAPTSSTTDCQTFGTMTSCTTNTR